MYPPTKCHILLPETQWPMRAEAQLVGRGTHVFLEQGNGISKGEEAHDCLMFWERKCRSFRTRGGETNMAKGKTSWSINQPLKHSNMVTSAQWHGQLLRLIIPSTGPVGCTLEDGYMELQTQSTSLFNKYIWINPAPLTHLVQINSGRTWSSWNCRCSSWRSMNKSSNRLLQ